MAYKYSEYVFMAIMIILMGLSISVHKNNCSLYKPMNS